MNELEAAEMAADLAFERALLASARADELPSDAAHDAWARFAAAAGALGAGAALAPALGKRTAWTSGWRERSRWLALGAAAGGAVTAALLAWPTAQAPVRVVETRNTAFVVAPALPNTPAPSGAGAPAIPSAHLRAAPPAALRDHARAPAPELAATAKRSRSAGSASSLAAEIAALDDVRRAMAESAFDRALEGVEAYAREFPHGQLAADADALAAQALAARGEHAAASERAQRFLERHPEDPHAARMRRLLDR